MFDSIIFDVDGTIWDSTEQVAKSWEAAVLEVLGEYREITAKALQAEFGKPMSDIMTSLFPDVTDEATVKALSDACFMHEENYLKEHPGVLYEGFEEAIKPLSQRYPLFIVSNCQSGYIEVMLEGTGLGKYFKGYTCWGDTGMLKDQNLLYIKEKYHLQSPIYVGDTQGDADACQAAGMPMIFASYGLGDVKDSEYRIDTPIQMIDIFR